jgi:hypothetical protein
MTIIYVIAAIFAILLIVGIVKAYYLSRITMMLKSKLLSEGYELIIQKERVIADNPGCDDNHLGIFLIRSKIDGSEKIIGVRYKKINGGIQLRYKI